MAVLLVFVWSATPDATSQNLTIQVGFSFDGANPAPKIERQDGDFTHNVRLFDRGR